VQKTREKVHVLTLTDSPKNEKSTRESTSFAAEDPVNCWIADCPVVLPGHLREAVRILVESAAKED
jgi:hypothetical protein